MLVLQRNKVPLPCLIRRLDFVNNAGIDELQSADDVNNVVHSSKLTTFERCNYKIRLYNFKIDISIDI